MPARSRDSLAPPQPTSLVTIGSALISRIRSTCVRTRFSNCQFCVLDRRDFLDYCVAIPERLLPQFQSQSRPLRRSYKPFNRNWHILEEQWVKVIVQVVHAFHDVEV